MVKMEDMMGKRITVKVTLFLLILVKETEGRSPVLHRVGGGRFTWLPDVNFTEWTIHQQFYVGDWLYFGFDKNRYNVLEVNKTNYERCIDKDFIKNVTRGGRDVYNLTEAKTYFFICGRGHCLNGMKVAVNVQISPPTLPALSPMLAKSSSSDTPAHAVVLLLILHIILAHVNF